MRGFFILTGLLGVWWSPAPVVLASYQKISWKQVPEAAFYEGVIAGGGRPIRFRTSSHWLIWQNEKTSAMGSKSEIQSVTAYNKQGEPIELTTTFERNEIVGAWNTNILPHSSKSTSDAVLPSEVSVSQNPSEISASSVDSGAGESSVTSDEESTSLDEALSFLDLEDPYVPEEKRQQAAVKFSPYKRLDERFVSLKLGFGQERLVASGGTSYYSGVSSIGGTGLEGHVIHANGLSYSLRLEGHGFEAVIPPKATQIGQESLQDQRNESFLRWTGDIRLGYEFLESPALVFVGQVGYLATYVPMLKKYDSVREEFALSLERFATPALSWRLFGNPSPKNRLTLIGVIFAIGGQAQLKGYLIEGEYQYHFTKDWSLSWSGMIGLLSTAKSVTCPSPIPLDECDQVAKSSMNYRQFAIGVGRFL